MLEAIFNPENAFFCFVNKMLDLILLSLLWALCCLPVVTAGAASTALYYAVVKSVRRQRSYPVREFLRSFRANLKKGILVHVLWMAFTVMMLYSDVPLFLAFLDTGKWQDQAFLVLIGLKALLLLGIPCWLYPLLSRFGEKLPKLAEAALVMLVRYLPVTCLSLGVLIGAGLLLFWEPLLVAVIPGVATLLLSFLLEPCLRKLIRQEEVRDGQTDTWYLEKG